MDVQEIYKAVDVLTSGEFIGISRWLTVPTLL